MKSTLRDVVIIIAVVLLSTVMLYMPFATNTLEYLGYDHKGGMNTIIQNYDGLYYVVPAMSGYNPKAIEAIRLEFVLPLEYYAAHFPLYPLFIAFGALLLNPGHSMLAVTIFFSAALGVAFYFFLRRLQVTEHPLALSLVFLFLPRFFIIRSVGAPESLFLLAIVSSIYFFEKKHYLYAGLLGAAAAMTKSPGILLFVAYGLVFAEQLISGNSFKWKWVWITLIPVGLLSVFTLYFIQYNDFFAYFHTGGVVPMPYPFAAFNHTARWVDTVWLEDIVLYFFIYLYAVVKLASSKYRSIFYFSAIFFVSAIFVQHRDVSRYLLPIWPFAAVVYEKFLTSKPFRIVLIFLLPAIFLYAINFLQQNVIPVADWRPFI
ncbi:MAG: hypothetical protein O3B87_05790 [bacterium]|nr:hypothetical protein [bacterium]